MPSGSHFRGGIAVYTPDFADYTVFPTGDTAATATTMGTDTTPAITITYLARVIVPVNANLTGIAILNGSAVAGNIKLGLFSAKTGVLVAQTASTAQAGTAAYQKVPFTAIYSAIGPGMYFVGAQFSSTSARFRSHAVGVFSTGSKTGETYGTFTTITPPSVFTADVGPIASTY